MVKFTRSRFVSLLAVIVLTGLTASGAQASPSAAGEVTDAMITAHGGMEAWTSAPTVSFEDEFKSGQAASGRVSRVTVEQGRRRAYLDFPGTEMRISWDGERAWSENWESRSPPRFLALLNYYFLNLPWMTKDPGVILAEPELGRLWDDPTEYVTVRMTFESDIGDTPDDYYVLYIHPDSHLLHAIEYAVTYKALLPEGAKSGSPKILVYDGHTKVNGLVVPKHYTIHKLDQSVYASCDIGDWSFSMRFDEARMTMPAGAVLDESTP